MDRRKFVLQSCNLCLALSAGMVASSLASCGAALPVYKTAIDKNTVTVPKALFSATAFQIIQPKNMYYNIGLKKENDGTFTALLLRCTHADNQLTPAGNGFKCTLHGSTFNSEGQVTNGPAERPLKRYPTEITNDSIIIHLS